MKLIAKIIVLAILFLTGTALYSQSSDEQTLAEFVDSLESGLQENSSEQTTGSEETVSADDQTIVTTTTTVTTTTVITQQNNGQNNSQSVSTGGNTANTPVSQNPVLDLNISGKKPLTPANLVMAEFLGAIVPGSGLAHFSLGDQRGGKITLLCTGVAALVYFGAEIAIETRSIDGPNAPNIYGALHYGSMGIFLAGYLYDLLGAPLYYKKYNAELNTTTSLRPLSVDYHAYDWEKDEMNLSVMRLGIQF